MVPEAKKGCVSVALLDTRIPYATVFAPVPPGRPSHSTTSMSCYGQDFVDGCLYIFMLAGNTRVADVMFALGFRAEEKPF